MQIPGHQLPPVILVLFLLYLGSFWLTAKATSSDELAVDDIDIVYADTKEGDGKAPLPPSINANGKKSDERDEEPKLDIKQTEILKHRDPQVLKTLIFGLPSPSVKWSLVAIAMNAVLFVFMADMVFRAPLLYQSHDLSFARVGFVSLNSANIIIREPDRSQLPIFVSYRAVSSSESASTDDDILEDSWKLAGKVYWLSDDTDFTFALEISHLRPSTQYQYAASNNHTGYFTTAFPVGQIDPTTDKFTFLTSSCIKPRFPYNPLSHPLSIPGFKHLATWIPSLHASFMLFLGDFIYIDVPHRFGTEKETYRREYRQVYASPDWPAVSNSLPWLHVIDDHEIANDWDRNTTAPYPAAVDPWNHYQGSVNPSTAQLDVTYYDFTQGPASFFMMDTRQYRSPEFAANASSTEKSMLGRDQLSSLLSFLSRREPLGVKWKIIVSSIPFTRNWRINNIDTWAGYLYERQIILEAMWDVGIRSDGVGVILLSGDRHEFAATAFPPPKGSKWPLSATVHEFSTSPLSMFYLPFRTYWEVDGEDDVCIKYLPDGNSKFGAVEISNLPGGEQSILKFRLFIDGVETWNYAITSPPPITGASRGKDAVWG